MKQPEIACMSQKLHHKKRHRRKRQRCFKIVNKAIKILSHQTLFT